ncbi:MAG: ATP-dependent protease LonB [Candidatus Thermoplasmatota archaeon]|jgi:Lon-like ATP-dependent protease|nr:ATP-dependent protease LonB [Candidatus Thermoplasmatota archaeon]MCL5963185.1 ATP-dependent protease LonB [Candidatus Thermoplasmatota archaeon]
MNNEINSEQKDLQNELDEWIKAQNFSTTADIPVPPKLMEQVIGQDDAVNVVEKASKQRRHVILVGDPGTGKSMIAHSMVDYLSREELQDILVYPNDEDANEPRIRAVPAGKGKEIVSAHKLEAMEKKQQKNMFLILIIFAIMAIAIYFSFANGAFDPTIIFVAIMAVALLVMAFKVGAGRNDGVSVPKLIVSHTPNDKAPFIDATGAHAGALLGDVKHDPFQSGGLETPPHERVEAGDIHKANNGVLFIDEINLLKMESQHSLLTALQEKKFPIIGQSERSAGAMVKTEPVPCNFILVAAGNVESIQGMHPALRSRIRGYGYEVYMKSTMPDNDENRKKLIRFVAQEVLKDKKIPPFDKFAIGEIIREAQRRAGRRGQLTLRLRELGGLIRVSGDLANQENARVVTAKHVVTAKKAARTLEQQIADRYIERKKDYQSIINNGEQVGVVNGLVVMGNPDAGISEFTGMVLPIVAEVTPAQTKSGGRVIATGKLGEIAKEAVENVSAFVKKYTGEDISNHDIHIQFIGTYEGVEGDSASISIATAVISAIENVPVNQNLAMTGSMDIRGNVLPIGGVTAKIEAAAEAGIKTVIIPKGNLNDVLMEERYIGGISIVPVTTLAEVLKYALKFDKSKESVFAKLTKLIDTHIPTPLVIGTIHKDG